MDEYLTNGSMPDKKANTKAAHARVSSTMDENPVDKEVAKVNTKP
jgi:hypothetical protein